MSLDGPWLFRIDAERHGEARGWQQPDYRPEHWLQVRVPGDWDSFSPELFGYVGHGWYRRSFRPRPAWRGQQVHLRFEGANYETTVWLNGRPLGAHSGGFAPFEVDVTGLIDWEGENTLAVRVDNLPDPGRVPSSVIGWWNYGGIYRSVKLLALPAVRVSDVWVRAECSRTRSLCGTAQETSLECTTDLAPEQPGEPAPLTVEATLVNESQAPATVALSGRVTQGGEPAALAGDLAAPALTLAAGESVHLTLSAGIIGARNWSPDHPHLYTLHLALKEGRTAVDTLDLTFGVRRFEVRGTGLYLNGEPIVLKGFDRHEEYPGPSRVDPGGMLEADLRLIKRMNGNIVRMHYQAHPDLYDLADRLGLMVFAEVPVAFVGWADPAEITDPRVREVGEALLRTLIGTLRNHPSVVIWSVGNECATYQVESRPLIGHLAQVARSLDPTRPVAYVGMHDAREKVFDLVDLPCINKYFGLRTQELAQCLDEIHALTPDKPLLVTEFGQEAIAGMRGEGYGSEDEQAQVLEATWRMLREKAGYIPGGLIWCLADYWLIFPSAYQYRHINRTYFTHGVVTLSRQAKRAVAAVKRMFARR